MKKIITLTMLCLLTLQVSAQKTYEVKKSTGTLAIANLKAVQIEGYDGKTVLITLNGDENKKEDERAKGLRPFGSEGFDNTGLGLIVTEKGEQVHLTQVDASTILDVKIKVPQGMKVSVANQSNYYASGSKNIGIFLKNLNSEVTISSQDEHIKLDNITGPLSVTSFFGNVEASINQAIKGPFSIVSFYGFIDMALPTNLKANLDIQTLYDSLLASDELNIKLFPNTTLPEAELQDEVEVNVAGLKVRTKQIKMGKNILGTINGGGEKIQLKAHYGKIYLRKK